MTDFYADPGVGGDGSHTTDDDNPTTGLANGGFWTRLNPMFVNIVNIANYVKNTLVANAAASASAAAASALTAINAPGTQGTSTTSLAVGYGSKSLTIQTGKSIVPGMSMKVSSTATPTIWMHGDVTSYNSGTGALVMNITNINGSGTLASWNVTLSGPGAPLAGPLNTFATGYTAIAGDNERYLRYTSASDGVLNLTAAGTLGPGWRVRVQPTNGAQVTVDPNGTEQIGGASTLVIKQGELWEIIVNAAGTGFDAVMLEAGGLNNASQSISTNQILTTGSAKIISYSPTVADLSVTLPDATRLSLSSQAQVLINNGIYPYSVRDNTGALLCVLLPGAFAAFSLNDVSTAAGVWNVTGRGINHVRCVKLDWQLSTVVPMTGHCINHLKMSETIIVFFGANSGTLYAQALDLTTMTLGSAVSTTGFQTSNNTYIAHQIGAGFGAVWNWNSGLTAISHVVFSVTGTTIAFGAVATKSPASAFAMSLGRGIESTYMNCAQLGGPGGTTFVFPVRLTNTDPFQHGVIVAQVNTGTLSVTWGTATSIGATNSTAGIQNSVWQVSATQCIQCVQYSNVKNYRLISVSGLVPTHQDTKTVTDGVASSPIGSPLQMASDEWWDMLSGSSTVPTVVRIKLGAGVLTVAQQTLSGSYGMDDIAVGTGTALNVGADNAKVFVKVDATTAYLQMNQNSTASARVAKITWNGSNFVISSADTVAPLPTNALGWNLPCVAGNSNGVFAFPYSDNGQTVTSYVAGYQVVNIATPNADNSPRVIAFIPHVYYGQVSGTVQAPEIVYKGGKMYIGRLNRQTASNTAWDVICLDVNSGEILSKNIVRRNQGNGARANRLILANNEQYVITMDGTYLTVLEYAK